LKYALIKLPAIGGPGVASANIEKMLNRYAEFNYDIVDNPLLYLEREPKSTLVHVQTTMPLLRSRDNRRYD
jgi:hypothetical protein